MARGRKPKRERFTTPVTCPECALNGYATWEESERGDLVTTIKSVSDGFRIERNGTETYCAECGVKAKIGKSLSRSEMKDPGTYGWSTPNKDTTDKRSPTTTPGASPPTSPSCRRC
jgi:hypothetical protein